MGFPAIGGGLLSVPDNLVRAVRIVGQAEACFRTVGKRGLALQHVSDLSGRLRSKLLGHAGE